MSEEKEKDNKDGHVIYIDKLDLPVLPTKEDEKKYK